MYPNEGGEWDASNKTWLSTNKKRALADYVSEWVALGATWIGGCCCVTPQDIGCIRQALLPVTEGNVALVT